MKQWKTGLWDSMKENVDGISLGHSSLLKQNKYKLEILPNQNSRCCLKYSTCKSTALDKSTRGNEHHNKLLRLFRSSHYYFNSEAIWRCRLDFQQPCWTVWALYRHALFTNHLCKKRENHFQKFLKTSGYSSIYLVQFKLQWTKRGGRTNPKPWIKCLCILSLAKGSDA